MNYLKGSKMFLDIADNILIVRYDDGGTDHDIALCIVLQICRKIYLKLNKTKFHFRCTHIPFIGNIIYR